MSERDFGEVVLRHGTHAEARECVGRTTGKLPCDAEVNWSQIKSFCALVRDGNPSYWDSAWASSAHGGLIAPPGTLMVWSMPLPWRPGDAPQRGPIFAAEVPLPGDTIINVSTDTRFDRPMRVGDQLCFEDEVVSVSPRKETALGAGHFITTRATYWNQRDERVAVHDNVLLRFTAQPAADRVAAQPGPHRAAPPAHAERLRPVVLPVTLRLCVFDAAATRDLFPGHHDRDYARAQNARDVYLNTMFFHGLADRVALEWAGPRARVTRRVLHMSSPVCAGDTLTASGHVAEPWADDRATLAIEMRGESGAGARASVTVALPGDIRRGPRAASSTSS